MHVAASVREQRRLEFENMHKRTKSRRFGTPPDFTNVVLMLEQEASGPPGRTPAFILLHSSIIGGLIEHLLSVDHIPSRSIYSGLELLCIRSYLIITPSTGRKCVPHPLRIQLGLAAPLVKFRSLSRVCPIT